MNNLFNGFDCNKKVDTNIISLSNLFNNFLIAFTHRHSFSNFSNFEVKQVVQMHFLKKLLSFLLESSYNQRLNRV